MKRIRKFIEKESLRYEKWIAETKEALAHAPEGSLKIHRDLGHIQYYHRTTGSRETYILAGNESLVCALAQKGYNRKLLFFLESAYKAMQCFLKVCPDASIDDIFRALSKQRQAMVVPLLPTREQFVEEWLARPYTPKAFRPDDTTAYYTQKGLRVRSKSELVIAELLDSLGIPYKYECPLTIGGTTIYPEKVRDKYVYLILHFCYNYLSRKSQNAPARGVHIS